MDTFPIYMLPYIWYAPFSHSPSMPHFFAEMFKQCTIVIYIRIRCSLCLLVDRSPSNPLPRKARSFPPSQGFVSHSCRYTIDTTISLHHRYESSYVQMLLQAKRQPQISPVTGVPPGVELASHIKSSPLCPCDSTSMEVGLRPCPTPLDGRVEGFLKDKQKRTRNVL